MPHQSQSIEPNEGASEAVPDCASNAAGGHVAMRDAPRGRARAFPDLPAEGFAGVLAVRGAFGGCGTSTLYDWIKKGLFPAPVRISPGRVGWHVDVVRAEIARRCGGAVVFA